MCEINNLSWGVTIQMDVQKLNRMIYILRLLPVSSVNACSIHSCWTMGPCEASLRAGVHTKVEESPDDGEYTMIL